MYDLDGQESGVTHYLVPANVSTKFEIFDGFGWKEAKFVIIALVIGFLLYLGTGLITRTETVNINDLSLEETIGLKDNSNTKIDGDLVTKKINIVPTSFRLFLIIIPSVGTFYAVRREPSTGMSLVTNLISAKEFRNKQRLYLFKHNSGLEGFGWQKKI